VFESVLGLRGYFSNQPSGMLAYTVLIGTAVFALSMGAWALVGVLASPLRRRLARLGGSDSAGTARGGFFIDRIRPLFPYLVPGKEEERSRIGNLLTYAGFRSASAMPLFYASKALLTLGLPFLIFLAAPFFPAMSGAKVIMVALIGATLGFVLPGIWLDRRARARQRELRASFPDALDLLVVCVESGLGLAPALQRVADDLVISAPELGGELALVNAEMRAGVERTQALKNLATRTGLDDIKGLVALLVQTMRFGTGVADALRVYSEEFRDKRMQAAEEEAAKIGTKMIFPLVMCLWPAFFLVAVGPAVIRLVDVFKELHH
jgi:tight adherence protein C